MSNNPKFCSSQLPLHMEKAGVRSSDIFPSLAALHNVCLHQNIPFVSYRLPLHSAITTLVQYESFPQVIDNIEELNNAEGFVVSPFTSTAGLKTYLLQPDFQFKDNNVSTDIISELSTVSQFCSNNQKDVFEHKTTSKESFESFVNEAVATINNGDFQKVVLSKTHLMEAPSDFSAPHFYQKLCSNYPHAYVYFLQLPGVGCWMGATPEPLLTTENEIMRTVSLAGTQPFTGLSIDECCWSDKELEEQAIVTNFIEHTLLDAGISEFSKSKIENYRAANLIHLKSGFEFQKSQLKNELSKLITALHPTPSVGGLPRQSAADFILKTETHNRAYYTGFLGTLHPENGCQLYVNLRCMQLCSDKIILYSGAGITASSVAEKEWDETENKLMTLKQVILS